MAHKIQFRRDSAANWTATDPILAQGEVGYETDTNAFKIGDGITAWSVLPYFASGGGEGTVTSVNDVDPDGSGDVDLAAADIPFVNTESGLTAEDVQAAINEIVAGLGDAAALDVGTTSGTVAAGDDSRFTDARTPTAHAASHASGAADAIKLDDLLSPDDNTDLNATTARHGLLPKLAGGTSSFLRADGTWAEPASATGWDGDIADMNIAGGVDVGTALEGSDLFVIDDGGLGAIRKCAITRIAAYIMATVKLDDLLSPDDNADLNASTDKHGLLPKLGGGTTNYLRSDGTWATPSGTYSLPIATTSVLGGIKPDGTSTTVDENGVLSATPSGTYSLPIATTSVLGGIKPDGTSTTVDENGVLSATASGSGGYSLLYPAQSLESPLPADWAVASNAPISLDASNAGIVVRLFSDSAENGAGTQSILIPDDATELSITLHWRAVTAPGGNVGVVWKLYHRSQNSTVGSWANQVLDTATINNTEWKSTSQTISLSTLGITAGDIRQFEITRAPTAAADTLAGNAALESIVLEFA